MHNPANGDTMNATEYTAEITRLNTAARNAHVAANRKVAIEFEGARNGMTTDIDNRAESLAQQSEALMAEARAAGMLWLKGQMIDKAAWPAFKATWNDAVRVCTVGGSLNMKKLQDTFGATADEMRAAKKHFEG